MAEKVERAIVVGAGVAGLMSALALQRQGISVHILERDHEPQADIEMPRSTDWRRRGVPQSLHPHHYMATMRLFIEEHYPEIIEHLISAGALKSDFWSFVHPRMKHRLNGIAVNDQLHSFMARRATFEIVLRRYVLAQPGISISNSMRATGLLTSDSVLPLTVQGVETDTEQLFADVVIDASGRSSRLVRCLTERWVPMKVEQEDSGIWYLTRHYRLKPGQSYPAMYGMPGAQTRRYGVGAIPSDNGVFYVSFHINHDDKELIEELRDETAFHSIASSHKEIAEWIDSERAEPQTRVHGFGQIDSYWKQTVVDGKPGVLNFFSVGGYHVSHQSSLWSGMHVCNLRRAYCGGADRGGFAAFGTNCALRKRDAPAVSG